MYDKAGRQWMYHFQRTRIKEKEERRYTGLHEVRDGRRFDDPPPPSPRPSPPPSPAWAGLPSIRLVREKKGLRFESISSLFQSSSKVVVYGHCDLRPPTTPPPPQKLSFMDTVFVIPAPPPPPSKVVVYGYCDTVFVIPPPPPPTINETLQWLSPLPTLMQESLRWWQCKETVCLFPHLLGYRSPPEPLRRQFGVKHD